MDGRLDTLHGFQKLLSLEVPSVVLLGWAAGPLPEMDDVLPPSLRHLCLTDDLHELGETEWEIETLLRLIQEFLEGSLVHHNCKVSHYSSIEQEICGVKKHG